jgi:hypothetical protein
MKEQERLLQAVTLFGRTPMLLTTITGDHTVIAPQYLQHCCSTRNQAKAKLQLEATTNATSQSSQAGL